MRRLLLLFTLAFMPLLGHAIEEPDYHVIRTLGDVELREYASYVVAEVVLDTTPADAGGQAFPILARYIFGKNKSDEKLEMTAPITQSAAPAPAPIDGGMRVQFVLPRGTTLETAPEPLDPRVRLRQMPAVAVAAIRYSGTWSEANYLEHLDKLKAALVAADVATDGEPVFARYNAPFTPWFMRRNEIWLTLRR